MHVIPLATVMFGNYRPYKLGGSAKILVNPLLPRVTCYAFALVSNAYNICAVKLLVCK